MGWLQESPIWEQSPLRRPSSRAPSMTPSRRGTGRTRWAAALRLRCTRTSQTASSSHLHGVFLANCCIGHCATGPCQASCRTPASLTGKLRQACRMQLRGHDRQQWPCDEDGRLLEPEKQGTVAEVSGDLLVLAVGNGRQAGGGVPLCPDAGDSSLHLGSVQVHAACARFDESCWCLNCMLLVLQCLMTACWTSGEAVEALW